MPGTGVQATVVISGLDRLENRVVSRKYRPYWRSSQPWTRPFGRALLDRLFDRLKPGGHQLVVFDINRMYAAQGLIKSPIDLDSLLNGPARSYGVSIVTNRDGASAAVILRERSAGETGSTTREVGLSWPDDVYSLSHIALPFAPEDSLYGYGDASENPGVRLGRLALRGENGTLAIPNTAMTRQHWNPFFPLMSDHIRAFISKGVSHG